MSLEKIRVSKTARDQLVTIKRRTGIRQWNIACRWGLCVSLAEPTVPRQDKIAADSTVEMTWHTFAGEYENVYLALLKQRCIDDAIEPTEENVAELFKLHLHRGIGYLAGDPTLKSIEALVSKSTV